MAPGPSDAELRSGSARWIRSDHLSADEVEAITQRDLDQIVRMLKERDRAAILVTYPLERGVGIPIRRAVESVATERGVSWVHTARDLERAQAENPDAKLVCRSRPSPEKPCLLINEMGPHPSGLLYGYIAESIGERVLSALGRTSATLELGRR